MSRCSLLVLISTLTSKHEAYESRSQLLIGRNRRQPMDENAISTNDLRQNVERYLVKAIVALEHIVLTPEPYVVREGSRKLGRMRRYRTITTSEWGRKTAFDLNRNNSRKTKHNYSLVHLSNNKDIIRKGHLHRKLLDATLLRNWPTNIKMLTARPKFKTAFICFANSCL